MNFYLFSLYELSSASVGANAIFNFQDFALFSKNTLFSTVVLIWDGIFLILLRADRDHALHLN